MERVQAGSRLSIGISRHGGSEGGTADDLSLSLASASTGTPTARTEGIVGSPHHATVARPHALLGIGRTQTTSGSEERAGPSRRFRKERGPNWSAQEVKALIDAKRSLHRLEQSNVDPRELMLPDASKWQRISTLVMQANVSSWPRDGVACKSKWNQLLPEYKRIADYFKRSGSDDASYWHLSFPRRRQEGLPRSFPQDVFWNIHQWYSRSPGLQPTHGRDLLQPEDCSFKTAGSGSDDLVDIDGSDEGSEGVRTPAPTQQENECLTPSMQSPASTPGTSVGVRPAGGTTRAVVASPRPPKRLVPAGVTPVVISSSETASPSAHDRPASTAVRRKSLLGHTLIAEATKVTGNALTDQMRDAADVSREIEQSKIDLQLRQFTEQMEFQRERDRRRQENSLMTQENARLSILKQGDVVNALANMTAVLSDAILRRPVHATTSCPALDNAPAGDDDNDKEGGCDQVARTSAA